ncbi:MAG: 8-amino-7-oxononanoate synthase [Peptococcaceae bacterium]|jgi:glycine C-acetyltransferase/8-amino-7-oxononanoate synthase|nr:8-amino-7-oxononanoate synthase [Peptococcaceae bacterium]
MTDQDRLAGELEHLREQGLYRRLRVQETMAGPRAVVDGTPCLMMASNGYLGLAAHPEVMAGAREALSRWGAGTGGSRLTTGDFRVHHELEEELADFKGEEAAILFGSGYMANLGVLSALAGPDDLVVSDGLNHASIIDGCRLTRAQTAVYRHGDTDHLAGILRDRRAGRTWIVTDGVFSMDGDLAPLPAIAGLADEHGAGIILDDAHATGVVGPGGAGTAARFGLQGRIDVQVGTLSKALGSQGAFVTGSRILVDYLRNRSRSFIFSTAPPPAAVGAARAALRLIRANPHWVAELREKTDYLRRGLSALGFSVPAGETPIIPVLVGDAGAALRLAESLLERGVFAPAIRPPSVPPGESRLRVTVMLSHGREDLDLALDAFSRAGKIAGVTG